MKSCLKFFAVAVFALAASVFETGCQKVSVETQKEKISYCIGWDIGRNFKMQMVDVDYNVMVEAMKTAIAGKPSIIKEEDMQGIMMTFQEELRKKQSEARDKAKDKNKKEGEDFLAKNKTQKGVMTTKSGLQYTVTQEGSGKKPGPNDTVMVNYRGTLLDGTEFDSSYKRNQPATFSLNGVIKGWTEGIQLMKEGAKYKFFIPPDLAYGEYGAGGTIGPNATLVFEVELISVQ